MAGPWERYQKPAEAGPWSRYSAAKPAEEKDSSFIDNAVRSVARGTLGIGTYLDELDAATNATLAPIVDPILPDDFEKLPQETWSERYDKALEIQRRKDKSFDEKNPVTSTGLKVTGGVASALAAMRANPAAANLVLGNLGKTPLSALGNTAAAAGATGLVQGFGEGEDGVENRVKQGLKEMAVSTALGTAMLPISAGVNKAVTAGRKMLQDKADDALSGLGKQAQKYVEKQFSDTAKVAAQKEALEKLGPDAVLADVSPEWLGVARGAATKPGMRSAIVDPLNERAAAANLRLRQDMRQNLGEAVIPSQVKEGIEESQRLVGQLYDPLFENARAVNTRGLADALDAETVNLRGPAQRAIREVRGYLDIPGTTELDPNPRALFAARNAIDGLLKNEQNPQVTMQLTRARQEVDGILAEAVPGIKSVDAQYAELSRQMGGLDKGRPVLNNEASALRPEEVERMLAEGANPEGLMIGPSGVPTRIKQSTRAEIERAIGTKANDTTALRNIVRGEGDWNRAKLGLLFGKENADKALTAIDRESVFGDTANRVTRGSDTAMASGFGDFLGEVGKPVKVPGDTTVTGLALRAGKSTIDKLMKENADDVSARFADQIGRLSVAKGDQRDAIVQALMRRGERAQALNDPKVQAIIAALSQSAARSAYPSLPFIRE